MISPAADIGQDAPAGRPLAQIADAKDRLFFALFAVAAGGLAALFLIGWREIDPGNLAWLRKDPAQYQAAWEFLRRAPWNFPPTWLAHLDYPFGISAAYLDVIPIVAVPLRLFARVLPAQFQYLGLWAVLCLILQAWFATKLLARFVSDRLIVCLGALFFVGAPILLNQLYGHFSLCGQWLILAALVCYFRPAPDNDTAAYLSPFVCLAAIAGGTTPYLAAMIVPVGLAAALRISRARAQAGTVPAFHPRWEQRLPQNPLLWSLAIMAAAGFALFVFGFASPGSGPAMEAPGYGTFALNLLSPFSPLHTALLFRPLPLLPGQDLEGYAYLGLGVMLPGLATLLWRPALLAKLRTPMLRPLLVLALVLTLLALSIRISLGPMVLAIIPVPMPVFHLLGIFRASGRFFWPVYYLLMLGALVGAASLFKSRAANRTFVAACLLLQFADMAGFASALAHESRITVSDPLRSPEWTAFGGRARHLVVLPAEQCDTTGSLAARANWYWFARLAARENLTLNSAYAARISARSHHYNCLELPRQVAQGILADRTVYVLDRRLAQAAMSRDPSLQCRGIDGFEVCALRR